MSSYALGGSVTGLLANTNMTLTNGNDTITVHNGVYVFDQNVNNLTSYNIALTQPPGHVCTFTPQDANTGSMVGAPVVTANITCTFSLRFLQHQVAAVAVGEPDMNSNNANHVISAASIMGPAGRAYQAPNGTTYFPDPGAYRTLVFSGLPTQSGAAAQAAIGQTSLNMAVGWAPSGASSTNNLSNGAHGDGNSLFLVDYYDNRVLVWLNNFPSGDSNVPTLVVGQTALTGVTNAAACTQAGLSAPHDAFVGGGKFLVADSSNNRVMVWSNGLPQASGASATLVLGQTDFTTCTAAEVAATSLKTPYSVWTDGNRVLVADTGNNRALYWETFPSTNGQGADYVLGQNGNFLTSTVQGGSTGMYSPYGITSDGVAIFLADTFWSRVDVWTAFPTEGHPTPSMALTLGQPSNVTGACNDGASAPTAYTLCLPTSVSIIGTSLVVGDYSNNRFVTYNSL